MKKIILLVFASLLSLSFYSQNQGIDVSQNNGDLRMRRFNAGDTDWKVAFSTLLSGSEKTLSINNSNHYDEVKIRGLKELKVGGLVNCQEVKVESNVTPDYVFQKYYTGTSTLKADYIMPTLKEVEAYTKANHHLPAMPSAKEIKENGLKLKEMTNLLLQKIEELTLYTIEQEKRINALEAKLVTKE